MCASKAQKQKTLFLWNLSFSKNKIPVLNNLHDHQSKIERTMIVNLKRVPYHEVRVMIIISAPLNCRNSASQIKEPHAITIARRGYKNRAPQLSELHATLL